MALTSRPDPSSSGSDPTRRPPATPADPHDPVVARRARIGGWAARAQQVGYALFAVAVLAFGYGAVSGFTPGVVRVVTLSLLVGSLVLAPSIVVGFGVRAAARDERRAAREHR